MDTRKKPINSKKYKLIQKKINDLEKEVITLKKINNNNLSVKNVLTQSNDLNLNNSQNDKK